MIRRWLQGLTPAKLIPILLGWCITLAGGVAFAALVGFGVAPLISNVVSKLTTTQVRFVLHRHTKPEAKEDSLWPQWWRYQRQKALTTSVNYGLFHATMVFEVPSLPAYFACVVVTKPIGLIISHLWTFRRPRKERS